MIGEERTGDFCVICQRAGKSADISSRAVENNERRKEIKLQIGVIQ